MERDALRRLAMIIVNPILDLANISVIKRQEINDKCDEIVMEEIAQHDRELVEAILAEIARLTVEEGYGSYSEIKDRIRAKWLKEKGEDQ